MSQSHVVTVTVDNAGRQADGSHGAGPAGQALDLE